MQNWPSRLWVVRHGQSAGNVARAEADLEGRERIALAGRDVDVPLSELGHQQATALGHWFSKQSQEDRPDVLLSSPYVRALQTARCFKTAGGTSPEEAICADERLREKEFGILDGLTTRGISSLQPEQYAFRQQLGKFYHRPPGGESWCDVIFRLRSLLDTVSLHYAGHRVMIFGHQVIVLCLRYILENMNEREVLDVDRAGEVANCGVTEYRLDGGRGKNGTLVLARYNVTAPMEAEAAPITRAPDAPVAARG
jgi:broad specificity phosphatase PhoE